jgi:hypothetical protein
MFATPPITLTNVSFTRCGTQQHVGGALLLQAPRTAGSTAILQNVKFDSNFGRIGGAIALETLSPIKLSVELDNCSVTNNTASLSGGGMAVMAGVGLTISNTLVSYVSLHVLHLCWSGQLSLAVLGSLVAPIMQRQSR